MNKDHLDVSVSILEDLIISLFQMLSHISMEKFATYVRMNRWTDTPSYRDVWPYLKRVSIFSNRPSVGSLVHPSICHLVVKTGLFGILTMIGYIYSAVNCYKVC